jgi:hypothetical protein
MSVCLAPCCIKLFGMCGPASIALGSLVHTSSLAWLIQRGEDTIKGVQLCTDCSFNHAVYLLSVSSLFSPVTHRLFLFSHLLEYS